MGQNKQSINVSIGLILFCLAYFIFSQNANAAIFNLETNNSVYYKGDTIRIFGSSELGVTSKLVNAHNLRIVDAFGNSLDSVSVGKQVQFSTDLTNEQDFEQPFTYGVKIQDKNDAIISLTWISGKLDGHQTFSPATSWTPVDDGDYTVTIYVWDFIPDPTPLRHPIPLEQPTTMKFSVDAKLNTNNALQDNVKNIDDVIIVIFNPKHTIVGAWQLPSNGKFSLNVNTSSNLWNVPGTYKVLAYQGGVVTETQFEFGTHTVESKTTKIFSIKDENGLVANIKFKTQSIIKNILFNRQLGELNFDVVGPEKTLGHLEIEIPKTAMYVIYDVMYDGELISDAQVRETETSFQISYDYIHHSPSRITGLGTWYKELGSRYIMYYNIDSYKNEVPIIAPSIKHEINLTFEEQGEKPQGVQAIFNANVLGTNFPQHNPYSSNTFKGTTRIDIPAAMFGQNEEHVLRINISKLDGKDIKIIDEINFKTSQLDNTKPNEEDTTAKGGQCAIATAAFGTELAPQVQLLREVRDNVLFSTGSGTAFMAGFNDFYYTFSPTIANLERQSPLFKEIVKTTITPMLATMLIFNYVDINSEQEMLGYGIGVILLNIGMYFLIPTIVITKIRQKIIYSQ